ARRSAPPAAGGVRCPHSRWSATNMLALGARVVGAELAKMIVRLWLTTGYEGTERHQRRVGQIAALERGEGIESK
ncbi:MAG: RpiB/LacA/LacB family sugar-phosphate isomerase, partial [Clostridia bacterium]|nr:RpiB/LacA/LacB family sugar-phosphate isomerase [Clostridia bacterium]